jgi:hypothetical protein
VGRGEAYGSCIVWCLISFIVTEISYCILLVKVDRISRLGEKFCI